MSLETNGHKPHVFPELLEPFGMHAFIQHTFTKHLLDTGPGARRQLFKTQARACLQDKPHSQKTRSRDLWNTGKSQGVEGPDREPGVQEEPDLAREGSCIGAPGESSQCRGQGRAE